MAESQVWIPVNASMRGFVSTVAKEAAKAAGAGGKNLEQGFRESGERSGQAVADGLAAQANKVDAASRALATARNAEVQASSDAAVAEEKLNQLRVAGNYTMGDLAKAETALEVAKQKAADAAARVSARESDLNTVREGGEATSRQLVRAEDQLAAARVKHIDATGKARAAEAVLEDAEQDAAMALERLEESTAALTTIREKYGAESKEAAAAEKELARAQKDSDKAALDVVKAQGQVKKAAADLANAQDDVRSKTMLLGGVQRDLADSVQRAGQEVGEAGDKVRGFGKDMDAAEGSAHGFVSGIADVAKNAAVAAAGVAGIGAAAAVGLDASGAISEMNLQLGLTGESAAALGQEVGDVLGSGLASNADEAAGAVGALSSQFRYLGSEGEQSAAQLSDNFLAFTKTFGVEMSEATQLAGSLITNGLAPDVETASDLMMAAFQRVPAAMRDELPEVMNEYGTFFSSLGFSGQEAFGLLVNSAELGKIGLDKVGDALKEFGIRATDLGDTGAVEALDALGLAGEDIQNRLLAGGETAKGAFDQVVDSLLGVKDPAEQAQLAVSLFGTPIEDLDKAKIPGFLKGLSDSGDAMAGFEGASQAAADTIANSLGGRMDKLKGTVTALASDGFMLLWDVTENKIVPAFQNFGDWVQRNEAWLGPLVAAVGAAAGVWGLWTGAILLWQNAVKVATAVQAAFNGVVALNPIMRAVMAVAALAAGVTYFFTQTETGRVMWQQFTDALSAGWDWVVGKFTAGWTWIRDAVFVPMAAFTAGTLLPAFQSVWAGIQVGWDAFTGALSWAYNAIILPVFNGLVTAGKFMFAVIATAVLTPMLIAWNLLSSGIQWGWETVIRPAWDLMVAAANWMWVGVLQPVFGWIQTGWQLSATGVQWYWENVILVAWTALQNAANWMWVGVLQPVFGWIQTGWQLLATGVQWYWENGILVAWTALQNAANWMYTNVLQPVFQWIGDRWNDMSRVLDAGRAFIVDTVFGGLQRGLDVVKDAFRVAPDAIGEAWEGVKAKTAVPVKFVIQTVFNEGIVEAWNKVAGWVGLEKIDKYEPEWLGSFAEGTSRVPGARTKHDNVHMMSQDGKFGISLRGGESVLVPEVTDALGPDKIDGMNAAAKMGGTKGVMRYLGGFAGGGVIGSITGLVNRFYPGMSITSTLRPGDPGWHGKGKAVDFSNGTDSTPQMRSAAEFFFKNYGPALLELIHSPFGNNVKNGQNVGDGFGLYGAGTMNAHRNHVHIAAAGPLPEPGDPITPVPSGGGGGGGVVNWLRDKVADALDGIFGPIGKAIPELPGVVGKLPRAAFDKMTGAVSNFIRGKADASGAYQGPVGSGVEQWRGLVESILQAKGFPTSLTDTVLRRMNQESGGNPRAINNWDINAKNGVPSKGLMQVIDPTFAANKDPGYNDIWDPESNIRASMNYAVRQYGSLPAAYNRAGGYHKGGLAPAGKGILHKTALEPEMVLNPDMTQAFIDWMGGTPHGESAAVVARELRSAFIGGDWGYGELASYIGEEMAKATVDVVAAIGRADRGFREWASATEEHDRMATPAEWAQHFGQQAGVALADDALGLVGLGGLIGKPLRGSFVDLVNAAVPLANDAVAGTGSQFRFGTLSASALQPVALLDDEGRRTGTKLAAAPTLADAEPATPLVSSPPPSVATTAPQVDNTPASGTTAPGAKNVIVLEGGKVYPAEELEKLNGRVDDVEVRVKKVEENQVADVTAGVSLMV